MAIAKEEVPAFIALMYGLELERFDTWMKSLPDGEPKRKLERCRARLIDAITTNQKDVADDIASLMRLALHGDSVEGVLKPLAVAKAKDYSDRQKPRASHQPEIDNWIAERLKSHPNHTAKQLWLLIPVTQGLETSGVYREDEKARGYSGDSERKGITFKTFENRLTRIKAAKNRS